MDDLQTIGNKEILNDFKLALFCSRKCPPEIIVKALDLAVEIRKEGITVIGGFQTIVEQDFLELLLKGKQNIIWCPARNIENNYHYPKKFKKNVESGRIIIISSFSKKDRRPSATRGIKRNYFVTEMADAILILHAAPNSNTEKLAFDYSSSSKKLFTIESKSNKNIVDRGFLFLNSNLIENMKSEKKISLKKK